MLINYWYAAFRQHWMNCPDAWYMRTFCITGLGNLALEQEKFERSDTGCPKLNNWARIRAAAHVTNMRVFYQNWRGLAKKNWWPPRRPKKPPHFSPMIVISELSLTLADCDLLRCPSSPSICSTANCTRTHFNPGPTGLGYTDSLTQQLEWPWVKSPF